ncbi:hypothetical protein PYH58_10650 [Mammaliicoccus sciuri]|uniref:hypothetical protein n=1 Tax=Mammaliicoccus sciuri TaxID=1296 RepID=UPI003364D06C
MFTIIQIIVLAIIGSAILKAIRNKDTDTIVVNALLGLATISMLTAKLLMTFEVAGVFIFGLLAFLLLAFSLAYILIRLVNYTFMLIRLRRKHDAIKHSLLVLGVIVLLVVLFANSISISVGG